MSSCPERPCDTGEWHRYEYSERSFLEPRSHRIRGKHSTGFKWGAWQAVEKEKVTKVMLVIYKIAEMAQSRACRVWELLVQSGDSITWKCI